MITRSVCVLRSSSAESAHRRPPPERAGSFPNRIWDSLRLSPPYVWPNPPKSDEGSFAVCGDEMPQSIREFWLASCF